LALAISLDDRVELLVRHRAAQRPAVDEEARGAARAEAGRHLLILLDLPLETCPVEGRLELVHVELQLLRVLLEALALERLLVGEELVVHLPELPLLAGGQGGLGGERRVLVEGQRVVLEDEAHVLR